MIREGTFERCTQLMAAVLGEGLEEIEERAFLGCASLRDINFPPRLRVIQDWAFKGCTQLTTVVFGEGLEEIGDVAFCSCTSLRKIVIPHRVRVIGDQAFDRCTQLRTVVLGEGLEVIRRSAFLDCKSLQKIIIPPRVRAISRYAFDGCTQLTTAVLGEGLEEIGECAFEMCTSLRHIVIPRAVTSIHDDAFKDCSQLTSVVFCNEIQEFLAAKSMQEWWNRGVHEKSMSTYSLLVRCNIPQRLCLLVRCWHDNVHRMLSRIPSISPEGLTAYFDSIDSTITIYEQYLRDVLMLLELAIWKSKITEPFVQNNDYSATDMRKKRRIDSVSNVTIIVPNVLSFL